MAGRGCRDEIWTARCGAAVAVVLWDAIDYIGTMLIHGVSMAVLLSLLLWAERREWRTGVWIFKPACSATFLLAAWAVGAAEHAFGRVILLALALSAAGDVLLIAPAERWFRAGLAAFLLAHVVFAGAFVALGVAPLWIGLALIGVVATGMAVLRWLGPHVSPGLRVPVRVYVGVISIMVACAAGAVGAGASPVLLAAAVVFWASDLFVARRRFVQPGWENKLIGLPLYYGAQLLFAWLAGAPA